MLTKATHMSSAEKATWLNRAMAGVDAAGDAARGNLISAASKAKVLPALTALGTAANAASAGYLGWQIGGAIRDIFMDENAGAPVEPAGVSHTQTKFAGPNESIACVGGKCAFTPTAGGTALFEKADGTGDAVGLFKREGCANPVFNFDWSTNGAGSTVVEKPPKRGTLIEGAPDPSETLEGCKTKAGFYFLPLLAANIGLDAGFPGSTTKTSTAPAAVPAEQLEGTAAEILPDPNYGPHISGWYDVMPEIAGGVATEGPFDPGEWPDLGLVPEVDPGEKIREYEEKLEENQLYPESIVNPEYGVDPNHGPLEVTKVSPAPGSWISPGEVVRVRYNPETAPEASAPFWSPPGIPGIDLSPLVDSGLDCSIFPFGMFCWVGEAVAQVSAPPECPKAEIPIHGEELSLSACEAEPIMDVVRPLLLFVGTIGIGIMFARTAMGTGKGGEE